jgi:hypothetical protein
MYETAFQSTMRHTQYEDLEQHLIGHAARTRQDQCAFSTLWPHMNLQSWCVRDVHANVILSTALHALKWYESVGESSDDLAHEHDATCLQGCGGILQHSYCGAVAVVMHVCCCGNQDTPCRASGASLHVSRIRTAAATRRAQLFASLHNSAFATVWDPVTNQEVRGKLTTVEYKPGLKIQPVWGVLPFDTQKRLNSPERAQLQSTRCLPCHVCRVCSPCNVGSMVSVSTICHENMVEAGEASCQVRSHLLSSTKEFTTWPEHAVCCVSTGRFATLLPLS